MKHTPERILEFYLDLGELLEVYGASAYEVTDFFSACSKKFQIPEPTILMFPQVLSISIFVDRMPYTGNRRFPMSSPNIHGLSALQSWLLAYKGTALPTYVTMHQAASNLSRSFASKWLACIIQCFATCCFFGGDWKACTITLATAGVSFGGCSWLGAKDLNILLKVFLSTLLAGLVAYNLNHIFYTETPLALFSATVIWLVPGLPMMNGCSDFFHDFMIMAIHRFAEAVMVVFAILLGIMPALLYMQPETVSSAINPLIDWWWAGIASMACAYRFEGSRLHIWLGFILGALGHGSRAFLLVYFGMNATTATLCSAALIGICVTLLRHTIDAQKVLIYIVTLGIIPLVPGVALLKAVYGLVCISMTGIATATLEVTQTIGLSVMAVGQVGALAVGGILPVTLYRWYSDSKKRDAC